MDNLKIKECPFCGNDDCRVEKHIGGRYFAQCRNPRCAGNSGFSDSESGAIETWNTRADCLEKLGIVTVVDEIDTTAMDRAGLSLALKALLLTRDYVGEDMLPALPGWEWYEACTLLSGLVPESPWVEQFKLRKEAYLKSAKGK